MTTSDIKQLNSLPIKPQIEEHSFKAMLDYLVADPNVQGHTSEDLCQLDPRDGSMIVFAEHRSLRRDEHNNTPIKKPSLSGCPICEGKLTHVVDYAPLSEGFSFISQNMFPVLYPKNLRPTESSVESLYPDPGHLGRVAYGFHLLQWTSSIHENDWHNMPFEDVLITMQRLAVLEEKLMKHSGGYMPMSCEAENIHGYFSVIKNFGPDAGASLTHGHQQIAFSNIMPQRTYNNWRFYERHQKTFSDYLLYENPKHLTIATEGKAKIIVPYFMRRPFNVIILLDTQAQHMHQLPALELADLTLAMQKIIKTFHLLLPKLGKEVSFNMAIHTGPDSKAYAEFFPVVQASGGFERIGLWICQLSADHAAVQLKELYDQL